MICGKRIVTITLNWYDWCLTVSWSLRLFWWCHHKGIFINLLRMKLMSLLTRLISLLTKESLNWVKVINKPIERKYIKFNGLNNLHTLIIIITQFKNRKICFRMTARGLINRVLSLGLIWANSHKIILLPITSHQNTLLQQNMYLQNKNPNLWTNKCISLRVLNPTKSMTVEDISQRSRRYKHLRHNNSVNKSMSQWWIWRTHQ